MGYLYETTTLVCGMTISPGHSAETKRKAVQFYNDGRLVEALQACEQVHALGDSDPMIFCLMGVIYGQLNQFKKSAEYSRRAIELDPDYLTAYANLALATKQLGRIEETVQALESILARNPSDAETHCALGSALEWNGDYERALTEYRTAQSLRPGYLDALGGEASVFEKRGEFDAAWNLIQPYVETAELNNSMLALVYARVALATGDASAAPPMLERYLETASPPAEHIMLLHFALGGLYDKSGDYDRAFDHYRQGNALKGIYFDSLGFSNKVDAIIGNFSRQRLDAARRSDCTTERPVFVVGMMRSGTSLVEQILSSHSAVYGAGELPDIQHIAASLTTAVVHDITRLTPQQLNAHAERYLNTIDGLDSASKRVVDKMPYNFLYLGVISLLFPNARIIHCKRNPLDTCLSCYFQNFGAMHPEAFDLDSIGKYYNDYRRLMAHWKQVLDTPALEVTYEELALRPEEEIPRILEFCGLEVEPACFSFHETRRVVRTASYGQVRTPMYTGSVERWRKYEKHIESLRNILEA